MGADEFCLVPFAVADITRRSKHQHFAIDGDRHRSDFDIDDTAITPPVLRLEVETLAAGQQLPQQCGQFRTRNLCFPIGHIQLQHFVPAVTEHGAEGVAGLE